MWHALRDLRRARWTLASAALLLVIQIAVECVAESTQVALFQTFGLSRENVLQGYAWAPLTYALIHANAWHWCCNAMMQLMLGARIESWCGTRALHHTWAGGALAGALFHLGLGGKATDLLVGASGVVMAMLLIMCMLSPQSRMFPLPVSARNLGRGLLLSSRLLMLINPDVAVPGFSYVGEWLVHQGMGDWFRMGHACHLGGALFGWCYARWMMRRTWTRSEMLEQRAKNDSIARS